MRSGLLRGTTTIAVPMRTRRVRAARYPVRATGDDSTERTGLKWISPSQTPSSPHASDASTRSKLSRNQSGALLPCRISSMKIPKSMTVALILEYRPSR